ncbi:MAG TPA: hypothetical protein VF744_11800 [Beijerinckiaceae bacterium]|jgi:hypothetical protein
MQKAFGVRVTIRGAGSDPVLQPLAVAARDERDAELIAAAAAGGAAAHTEVVRELTPDEARDYGLDLTVPGDVKALPALNF